MNPADAAPAAGAAAPPRGPRATPAMLALAAPLLLLPLALDLRVDPAWRAGLHVLLELGVATIAFAIFLLTWSTRGWRAPVSLVGTGVAMLGVALLAAAHLVSAPGMPGMRSEAACAVSGGFAFGAQAWLAAAMLFTALAPWRSRHYERLFGKALAFTAAWTAGVAGMAGLAATQAICESPQRQWSEQALLAAFGAAALLLARRGQRPDTGSAAVLAWAAWLMAGSAALFVLQPRSHDLAVVLAHVYKLAGCGLVYLALFREGVDRPFRRIAQSERLADGQRAHYRQFFDNAPDGVLLVDGAGRIADANPAALAMFGWEREALVGARVEVLVPMRLREQHARWRGFYAADARPREMAFGSPLVGRRRDGSEFPVEVALAPQPRGGLPGTLCIVRDVSRREALEDRLLLQATHDALTALPNRRGFEQRLAGALARTRRCDRQLAVMFIDLDEFRHINDTLGHHRGDALLREVARRLRAALRGPDTLARLGGDEFAVLIENVARREDGAAIARKLLDALAQAVHHEGRDMHVAASIGIALFPADGQAGDELLRHADLALHRAKAGGGQRWCFFESEMDQRVLERAALQQDLHAAASRGELHLHYQPRVYAADGRLSGFEALLRWRHPQRGELRPDRFIPLAERSGSIVPIGEWVLREACAQARRWSDAGLSPRMLAVNVSARQLRDPGFPRCVEAVLRETGWPAQQLELELTETALMEESDQSTARLGALADLGVRLAVDDFGTGYSSLAYLKRFKLHRLKVDKSFVKSLESDRDDRVIASTVIVLGHALGLQVTAEGVETAAQSAFLAEQGCDELQGFLFSPPLPPADCERLMRGGAWPAQAHAARQMPLLPPDAA